MLKMLPVAEDAAKHDLPKVEVRADVTAKAPACGQGQSKIER